jgi:hypothetical protein
MSKHTPGPWIVATDAYGAPQHIKSYRVANTVASFLTSVRRSTDGDEIGANARLIAAAPDLLDALQSLEPLLEAVTLGLGRVWVESDGTETDFGAALDVARAVIANATGEPRFQRVYCSQCGGEFPGGNEGFSHCSDHGAKS